MDQWEIIRLRCVRDGEPIKCVARELGLAPNTVRKYVRSQSAPAKMTLHRPRRLERYRGIVDEYLRSTPKITAKRVGVLLRAQYDASLQIGERALREFVALRRRELVPREAFVRAQHLPGDQAQFDFSPMPAIIAGVLVTLQVFAMRLSYSGAFFARASYHEDRPSLFTGLLAAVRFFEGLPRVAIFDNPKTAVQRILRGRNREQNGEFRAFCGALALEVEFAAPRRGNEKGGVEGLMGYIEDNVFRPIPSFASVEECNAELERFCRNDLQRQHSIHRERIGERFARDRAALRPLPERLPQPCITTYARISKFAEVVVDTNRYSTPTRYAHRDATVQTYEGRVVVLVDGERVAEHRRAQGKRQTIIDPLHYLELISRKHRSATRALAFADQRLPQPLLVLRDRLIERDGPAATKTWMTVLRLALESSLEALVAATEIALSRGTLDPQAIALLVRQRADGAPVMDLAHLRLTPARHAQPVDLGVYRIAALVEPAS